MAGSSTENMFPISGRYSDCTKRQGFTYGRAGTIKPIKRTADFCNSKRRGNGLRQQISGKDHSDFRRGKSRFLDGEKGCFFLHGTFCIFPGVSAKLCILTDLVKRVTQWSVSFFFTYNGCCTLYKNRFRKRDTCISQRYTWFHPITSSNFRI